MILGFVYAARRASDGHIKIGFSTNVPLRMRALGQYHGSKVALIGADYGTLWDERRLQNKLLRHGEWRDGRAVPIEWFHPAPAVLRAVGKMKVWPNVEMLVVTKRARRAPRTSPTGAHPSA